MVFLVADDQRADMIGAHGNPHIRTHNLDRLAVAGVSFRRNFCAGSFSGAVSCCQLRDANDRTAWNESAADQTGFQLGWLD
jgi:hypothetical protein